MTIGAMAVQALAAAALCAGPSSSPDDSLLVRFQPVLYFESRGAGPGGWRTEYPINYTFDDSDIEDNLASPAITPSARCYGTVHQQRDSEGKVCWVICYDFYYPRNWTHVGLIGIEWKGFTHEHDWEWLYIVAGLDRGRIVPYCACFSAHSAQNRDVFGRDGGVGLFPGVTGGSVWKRDWNRNPSRAPRVSIWSGDRVEATAMSTGNGFDGSGTQLREGDPYAVYPIDAFESRTSSCGNASTYFFGDPALSPFCIYCSPSSECADPVLPPWSRDGLDGNNPLPADFALPADWDANVSTEVPVQPVLAIAPNPARDEVRLVCADNRTPCSFRFALFDAEGRRVRTVAPDRDGRLDLSGLCSGAYWLRADRGDGRDARRILIVR